MPFEGRNERVSNQGRITFAYVSFLVSICIAFIFLFGEMPGVTEVNSRWKYQPYSGPSASAYG